jgi:hypothetical protein
MTSQYRHRRTSNPATPFPAQLEPGEIAANTANRQLAVGDAAPATIGTPTPLLAVRIFDARGLYAVGDYVVNGGWLYRCVAAHGPAAFNLANFEVIISEATITDTLDGYLTLVGGTMTGPIHLPIAAPNLDTEATNKKYVDDSVSTALGSGVHADSVNYDPFGSLASVTVGGALDELDAEKAPIVSPAFLGVPTTAGTPPVDDSSVKLATTEFVTNQAANVEPLMDGVPAIGTSKRYARQDHRHTTDTSRAPLNSPNFTGTPYTESTPAEGDNSLKLATTAYVMASTAQKILDGIVTYAKMATSAIATTAEFLNRTPNKILTTDKVWAAGAPITLPDGVDGSFMTPDLNLGVDFIWTLGGSRTLNAPLNIGNKIGQKGMFYLIQGGTGTNLIGWANTYKFPGGTKPVLSTAVGTVDVMSYTVRNSTEIHCFFAREMK